MSNEIQNALPSTTDHLCIPCDVETMARRSNLSPRRCQQLAKEGMFLKNEQGEYICPHNLIVRIRELDKPKRKGVSNLTKKQEESLEIRNARDRMASLAEWESMVMQKAVIEELAPIIVTLKNGIRELESVLAGDVVMFAKEHAIPIADKDIADHELMAKAQKILSVQIKEKLNTFVKDINVWIERQDKPKELNGEKPKEEEN